MNNEKCKYCDYVSKCSRLCEYGSYLCCLNRSFPKVVDKSYEELQKEVEKLQHYKTLYQSLKRQKDEATEWVRNYMNEWDINDEVRQELNDLLILLEEVE